MNRFLCYYSSFNVFFVFLPLLSRPACLCKRIDSCWVRLIPSLWIMFMEEWVSLPFEGDEDWVNE
jgi:hypothetical protein